MKESHSEVFARHAGPESYADGGNIVGVVTAGVHIGPEIELRNQVLFVRRRCLAGGRQHLRVRERQELGEHGGVEGLVHVWKLQAREPGDPIGFPILGFGTVRERLRRHDGHARRWEVRWSHSTCETDEQCRNPGGGARGGKGITQGKCRSSIACIGHSAEICKALLRAATAGRDCILTVIPKGRAV